MILGYNPVLQALLGTLLTWGLTAAGSALVFIFSSGQRRILDGSLGFAAGGINVSPQTSLALNYDSRVIKEKYEQQATDHQEYENELSIRIGRTALHSGKHPVIYHQVNTIVVCISICMCICTSYRAASFFGIFHPLNFYLRS
uniref:Zinc transporter ZIP11 n=1 Tax=Micrurus paraensis TaxID=1970185 RepID=A0A2D4JVR9_9SAUR